MTIGSLLLFAAYLITGAAAVVCALDLWRPGRSVARFVVPALHGTATALTLLVLFLAALFLIGDTSFAYVWRNVDLSYPWHQRLSGVWVGREGSLLLWTAATALFLSIDERRHGSALRRSRTAAVANAYGAGPHPPHTSARPWPGQPRESTQGSEDADVEALLRNRRVVRVLLSLLVLLLMTVLVDEALFKATGAADLAERPGGRGVNPQLVTLYNTIHPPIVLIGYALTALPAAFAIAHLVTGRRGWIGPARRWAHLAFLFLTAGVILGALWAYIALGWGGYWAWDPVEVGILVPWTVTTAFLHAALRYDERGDFAIAAPTLALLGFTASMFSTFIVRAGGIWVSVHSFLGAGDAQDAWGRFLAAYDSNLEVKLYTWLLGLSLAAVLPLLLLHVNRIDSGKVWAAPAPPAKPAADTSLRHRLLRHLDLRALFLVGVLLLALLATVIVTILIVGIDGFSSDAARTATFESRTGPLALLAVTVMSVAIGIGFLARTVIAGLHVGALAAGALLGLVMPGDHMALTMAVTVLAVASGVALLRVIHAIRTYRGHRAWRITGTHLVHLGVAVVLIGHGVVSAFATDERIVEFQVGERHSLQGQWVQLVDIERLDRDRNGGFDTITASFLVWDDEGTGAAASDADDGILQPPADAARVDIGFGYYESTDHYKPHVGIQRDLLRDLYLAPRGVHDPAQDKWVYSNLPLFQQGARELMDADAVTVGVSTLPYINLVWSGSTLMVLGAMGIVVSSHRFRPWRDDEAPAMARTAPDPNHGSDATPEPTAVQGTG